MKLDFALVDVEFGATMIAAHCSVLTAAPPFSLICLKQLEAWLTP